MQTYQSLVSQLLSYTNCQPVDPEEWPNYIGEFGFTEAHIPDLLALMQDELLLTLNPDEGSPELDAELDPELAVWGPIHAWRALGQLQAMEFLDAAIGFLKSHDLDWAWEEFPDVLMLIGPPIIESLGAAIKTEASNDVTSITLVESLQRIAETFPEARDRSITLINDVLKGYEQNHDSVNASLIAALLKLNAATESLAIIEAAYQAERVDEFYSGTWAQVQIDLGLKTKADFTEAELTPRMPPALAEMQATLATLERMRKPDAFSRGLPLDPRMFPSSKPPEFGDMLTSQQSQVNQDPRKGFGGPQTSGKKSKKKKKR